MIRKYTTFIKAKWQELRCCGYLLKIEQSLPMMLQNEISFYNYNVVKIFIAEKDFGMINELLELKKLMNK